MVIQRFKGQVCKIAFNKTAQNVLKKFMNEHPTRIEVIFQEICHNFFQVATDQNMMCILKELINLKNSQKLPVLNIEQQKIIAEHIIADAIEYSSDQYANFVVGSAMQHFNPQVSRRIFE